MIKKRSIAPLFNPSGCLTLKAIRHCLEGSLSGEDQKRVMDHLDTCILCRDAVDGLAKAPHPGAVSREIYTINRQILEKTSGASSGRSLTPAQKTLIRKVWTYAAAASVILLASIYFLLRQPHAGYQEPMIALNDTIRKDADQMRHQEPVAAPDPGKIATKESIPTSALPSGKSVVPETEPEAVVIEEEKEILADGLISPDDTAAPADRSELVQTADQNAVVEMEEMAVEEPPVVIEGIAVGGVSARKEKSAYRTVTVDQKVDQEQEIFTVVEQIPEFPGGSDSLSSFLRKNLHYPEEALASKTEGTVYLTFVVEKDGSVSGVQVLRGVSDACDQEAIRVVKAMPDWIPARQRNTPVRVQYTLPIPFQLPK